MKQILQELNSGKTIIEKAPTPSVAKGHLLIETTKTLISVGTEKMLVDFSKGNYLQKAKQQPEKVKMVLDKVKTEGLVTTVDAVRTKLNQPLPLGYCNAGRIIEIGEGVSGFKIGDRVASNGPHADIVHVPQNLCALIPDNVSDEEATFTVISSIGLQAIRLASPTIGEYFVVSGVGLIGLLTVQLLIAQGCKVLALDYDSKKLELAKSFGAEICNLAEVDDPVQTGMTFSKGNGVDGVIVAASTSSNDPITHAAKMSRKRGRIILLGVVGMEFNRSDFYEKELVFQVSCSYGPGRYDEGYEKRGLDYPFGFVRWTENRNFLAILDLLSQKKLSVERLIEKSFDFSVASQAFDLISEKPGTLGVILSFDGEKQEKRTESTIDLQSVSFREEEPVLSFLGAGNYAARVLIPAFKKNKAQLDIISSRGGLSAAVNGRKLGFRRATTDNDEIFKSSQTNTIVVATQHSSHGKLTKESLMRGKNVFVEKPLALKLQEIDEIEGILNQSKDKRLHLMIGFNRRFSSLSLKMKSLLEGLRSPMAINISVNAGFIPSNHWTQNEDAGGGRIVGEACHFIDYARFLVGSPIVHWNVLYMEGGSDTATIQLKFSNGSLANINYFSNGSKELSKERIEVFCEGKILLLDNFIKLKGFGWRTFKSKRLWRQDKGQGRCCAEFLAAIKEGKPSPIPVNEIFEVSRVSIQIAENMSKIQ
jgi:predicted dehydrogenase/threonine dehydrogenase-like Zn-dependent dehydrogenase